MKKMGNMADSEYQGCYSHALHLSTCGVLLRNNETIHSNDEVEKSVYEEVEGGQALNLFLKKAMMTETLKMERQQRPSNMFAKILKHIKV